MNHLRAVKVLQCLHDLKEIVLHFHFSKSLPTLEQFVQSLIRAYFQQNVNILVILEDMLELHNIRMAQGFMDFYFSD